jgi:hypothetical protein
MYAHYASCTAMPYTTVRIDIETRDELRARGRMGESYDEVIRRLLSATQNPGSSRTESRPPAPKGASKLLFANQQR